MSLLYLLRSEINGGGRRIRTYGESPLNDFQVPHNGTQEILNSPLRRIVR
jgi:hypothetical protein